MADKENGQTNGQKGNETAAAAPVTQRAGEGGGDTTFMNELQAGRDALERECQEIATWIEQQTGIKPTEVRHAPPWQGEDKRIGVEVFFARGRDDSGSQPFGTTDWWIVREKSGERHVYPTMLSTAADAVKYHHQVRKVQLKTRK